MIKYGTPQLVLALQKLFNLILEKGVFPRTWFNGLITPIFKSGAKNDTGNYRAICVTGCLGKLFFSVLNSRITSVTSHWGN